MELEENVVNSIESPLAAESAQAFWLSPQQSRIWSEKQERANAAVLLALDSAIDQDRLRTALDRLVQRHEIFRTVFRASAGMKVPFQIIIDWLSPSWEIRAQSLDEAFDEERLRQIDLEHGPVLHASLIHAPGQEKGLNLILCLPALLSDSASLAVVVQELKEIYNGFEPESPSLPYVQFAQWQSDLLESDDENALSGKAFWSKQAAPGLTWPSAGKFRPDSVRVARSFKEADADRFLAAWQCLLSRLTGQEHFETRVWFSGREHEELTALPGPVGKFLPLPARFHDGLRFEEIVSQVRTAREEAVEWQEYYAPGDESSALFEFRPRLGSAVFPVLRQASLAERFAVALIASGDELEFHYDGSRFSRETVVNWASHYEVLLDAALSHPQTVAARLPVLSQFQERQILVEWNRSEADYPRARCLHELFELQAERTPDNAAVLSGSEILSYAQLNRKANTLARHLRGLHVGPDSLVGLALDRGVNMIVAVLGILKAGGAYVPVSADHPKARLAHQLTGTAVLITESKLVDLLPDMNCPKVLMDDANWQSGPSENLDSIAKPDNLVYVIYTSGSTGVPKGVAVRHRNLVNYAYFIANRLPGEHLHFATVSPLTADLGNTCVFPSLISGGCLHVIPHEVSGDSALLTAWQKEHPYDVLKIVPSHLSALLETDAGRGVLPRKHLVTGGESLSSRLVERVRELAPCQIWNHYGPTETTVGALMVQVEGHPASTIPIGRPVANTQVYILDSFDQPVPAGVAGQLCIAGDGVSAGYLNQPELTAQRFSGGKYRSGDLARFRVDGAVEFLGRADHQVKIHGYRVELGEIESVMARYPGVRQAVVVSRPDERGDFQLAGYAAALSGFDTEALREFLKTELPPYMVPPVLITLPKLPLTSNGKIDRQNLPLPEMVKPRTVTAPRTSTEQQVAAMWCEIFRRSPIGIEENFFDLGGHSLLATQVISRIREHFNVHLDMTVLFRQPTIEALSREIDHADVEAADFAILPVPREKYRSGQRP